MIEVLIAVAIFAIVLAAINTVFYSALRLRNRSAAAFDEALPVQQTVAIIKRDLANLVLPGGTLSGALQTTTITNAVAGQSSPDFYTSTGLIDETSTWGEVQRVAYYLLPSTNGTAGKDLYRSVTRNLLPSLQEQPVLTPLLTGVQSVFFFYHDGTQWQDTWDSTTQTPPLPKAIKVQITLAPEELGRPQTPPVELVVPLLVEAPTNQTAQATQP